NMKIDFQCLEAGCYYIWSAAPDTILNGKTGCPNCSFAKNETLSYHTFQFNGIDVERHKNIRTIVVGETRDLRVDFYYNNTIIEYNGRQHYQPVQFGKQTIEQAKINFDKQVARDSYLEEVCKNNNIKLVWIDGRKYTDRKLEEYIIKEIIPHILV